MQSLIDQVESAIQSAVLPESVRDQYRLIQAHRSQLDDVQLTDVLQHLLRHVHRVEENRRILAAANRSFSVDTEEPIEPPRPVEESDVIDWLRIQIGVFNDPELHYHLDSGTMYGLLYGYVQSGKSKAQAGVCMYNAFVNHQSTLWILRNLKSDVQQAKRNIDSQFGCYSHRQPNQWIHYCVSRNIESDKFLMTLDNGKTGKKARQAIMNALSRSCTNPKVILVMANDKQLSRLCREISEIEDPVFNIVVDEVDEIALSDRNNRPARDHSYMELREYAKNILGVSATNFNVLWGDEALQTNQVFRLIPPTIYRGVRNFYWQYLEQSVSVKPSASYLEADTEWRTFLSNMSLKHVYECRTAHDRVFRHPVIVLAKTSHYTGHHEELVQYMVGYQEIVPTHWVAISFDGKGILMYHKSFERRTIRIQCASTGEWIQSTPNTDVSGYPIQRFEGLEIGDVLEYLRSHDPQVRRYTHILIVSGRLANRGINYVSNNYSSGIHPWHISDMYYKPSDSTDATDHIQAMRPCGTFDDDLPITIHTFRSTRESILKSFNLQEKVMTRIMDVDKDESIRVSLFTQKQRFQIRELPPYKYPLNKRYSIRLDQQISREPDTLRDEVTNSTDPLSPMTGSIALDVSDSPSSPSPSASDGEEESKELIPSSINYPQDEPYEPYESKESKSDDEKSNEDTEDQITRFVRNLTRAIDNNRHTIIRKILRFFRDQVDGGIEDGYTSREDITNACDFSWFGDYTRWTERHGRARLFVQYENDWKINPEVTNAIQHLIPRL
jgi:hypothetical protein